MKTVLVIGNINRDTVLRLDGALRPGARLSGQELAYRLGGAGANAALGLAYAGHRVRLVGFVGSDAEGDWILKTLRELPLDIEGVIQQCGRSGRCMILIDSDGERTIVGLGRTDEPTRWPQLPLEDLAAIHVASRWPPPRAWLLEAHKRGLPVVAAWSPKRSALPASVLVASGDDWRRAGVTDPWTAVGRSLPDSDDGHQPDWLIITEGAAGAWATNGEQRLTVPAIPTHVVDATGAGDCFTAAVTYGLALGWPIRACLDLAVRWGALAVANEGSTAPADVARWTDRLS